jgi:hypothetical protein
MAFPVVLFTCSVFLDDASVLAKLDPVTWPERHGNIECRTRDDNIAQACRDFLSCRFDPDDLETQLKLSDPRGVEQTANDESSPVPETEP